jgi:dedicated sortase system histidine kinase
VSLRLQLLAFGLLTLVLPWTGLRYVEEMEAALRGGLEQALLASATTVAAALEEQRVSLCPSAKCGSAAAGTATTIYSHPLDAEPRLDGVRDDWDVEEKAAIALSGGHQLWSGTYGRFVYLFVAVEDRDLVYQRAPGQTPFGDRLVLATAAEPGDVRWLLLVTGAPGAFRAQETAPDRFEPSGSFDGGALGFWQETATGYAVEARLPLGSIGSALGVGVIDVDPSGADYAVDLEATWDTRAGNPGRFVHQPSELQALLAQFGRAGGRFRVLDADGWVLSDVGSVDVGAAAESGNLIEGLLRFALRRDDPPYPAEQPAGRIGDQELRGALEGRPTTAWYGSGPGQDAIVVAAVPLSAPQGVLGAVLLERATDPILTLTDQALVRLMTVTLATSVIAALALLGYATWLSFRVRRLSQAAETALGPRGEIRIGIPDAAAKDELGDLARSFTHLLERLREHTEYLRSLASKLSHELRTPLAVVSTSLDNLEHEVKAPSAEEYLGRLRQGTERLDAILAAMSEATELEQAINETAAEPFDLGVVVESCCRAYRDVYSEREIVCRVTARSPEIIGSGELIAQLLDKLIDNAVSFSAAGSRIDVELADSASTPGEIVLSVTNRGPLLPEKMRAQLFDSLVSIREKRDGRPHLGLGLHIVELIAAFHGGRVEAEDLPDRSGVVFRVRMPRRVR